ITNLMEQQGASQAMPVNVADDNFANEMMSALSNIDFVYIIGWFIFFFLGGYLLYAAMFAAVGSAVDNEADTQQLVVPITIPLILAIVVMVSGLKSPDGTISFWFSMIPFTSPIVMITRLPYGVPPWELALSATLLVVTFVFMTWLAAKIYRTGILLYGKKHTWGEMWKWIKYSN
ncbi:MAG: ABC transporter permease, partial [Bacteroidetes bacterium HGW-Bacteroidetes-15]